MTLYMRFLRALGLAPRIASQLAEARITYDRNSNMMCITFDLNGARLIKIQDYQDQNGEITILATYEKKSDELDS